MYDDSETDGEESPTKVMRTTPPKLTATTYTSSARFPDIPPARPMRTKTTISLRQPDSAAPVSADPTLLSTDDEQDKNYPGISGKGKPYGTVTGVRRETIMSRASSTKQSLERPPKNTSQRPLSGQHRSSQRARKTLSVDTTLDRRQGPSTGDSDYPSGPQHSAPVLGGALDRHSRVSKRKSQKPQHGVKKQWHALLRFLTIESPSPEGEDASGQPIADDEREMHGRHLRSNSGGRARQPRYDQNLSPKAAAMAYKNSHAAPQRPIRPMTQIVSRQGTMKRSHSQSKHGMDTRQKHMTGPPPAPLPKDTVYLEGGLSAFANIKTSTAPFNAKNPRPVKNLMQKQQSSHGKRDRTGISMASSVGPSEMRTSSKRLSKYPSNFDAKWSSDDEDDTSNHLVTMGNEDMDMDNFETPPRNNDKKSRFHA